MLAGSLGGCDQDHRAVTAPPLVEVETFSESAAIRSTRYAAEVTARFSAPLAFQVGGRVIERRADTGDRVAAGELLARIDPRDLENDLDAVQQQLTAARSELERSRRELVRLENLGEGRFASVTALDNARNLATAAAARVRELEARLALARNRLGYSELRSTVDGTVTARLIDVNQVVAAGEPAFAIARLDTLEATAWIPEQQIHGFEPGEAVAVALWAFPQERFVARIREIAPQAEAASRSFRIRAALPTDPRLRLGQTGSLALPLKVDPTGSVPVASVRRDDAQQPFVLVVVDGVLAQRSVELGGVVDNRFQVHAGLVTGDQVVVLGATELAPGQHVRVHPAD